MKKLQQLFTHVVDRIENYDLPLKRYLFLFLAILGVRLSLEFFSNQRLFRSEDTLHIALWFTFIVLAFMLQLHLFSKVDVRKIMKLVVCCFSIALTAPMIDMVVSQGAHVKMNYLSINSFSDVLFSYLTIGGASLNRGATLGIRIEIVLLVLASLNYLWLKTGSILRTFLGTWCIYSVLFLSGTLPFFLGKLNTALGLTYQPDDQSSISLLLLIDLILFLILIFRLKKHSFSLRFSIASSMAILGYVSALLTGIFLARMNYPDNWNLNPTTLYNFPLLLLIFVLFLLYENVYRSEESSADNFNFSNGILAMVICSAVCISFHAFFSSLIIWGSLFVTQEKPLRFGRVPYIGSLFRSVTVTGYLLLGFMTFGAPMIGIPTNVILLTLTCSFSMFICLEMFKKRYTKKLLHENS